VEVILRVGKNKEESELTLSSFYVDAYIMNIWKSLWNSLIGIWYCNLHKDWNNINNFVSVYLTNRSVFHD